MWRFLDSDLSLTVLTSPDCWFKVRLAEVSRVIGAPIASTIPALCQFYLRENGLLPTKQVSHGDYSAHHQRGEIGSLPSSPLVR